MHNRRERLVESEQGPGVKCEWQWTSDLHIAKVFPACGKWLLMRALRDYPVVLAGSPVEGSGENSVDVSFIIGHRGEDRLPLLLQTIRAIAGQRACAVECIVVEQHAEQTARDYIPNWVRYIHTPVPDPETPFSRAWAFNVGARAARAECLIFNDGDMLVCRDYAQSIRQLHRRGFEFINLKRFVFYLSKIDSENLERSGKVRCDFTPDSIMQNAEAGGTVGVDKSAFWQIGGFDERFVGWGGEDNEFWERAQTRVVYPFGYLPVLHLWHEPQQEKHAVSVVPPKKLYRSLTAVPVPDRVRRLREIRAGEVEGPRVAPV